MRAKKLYKYLDAEGALMMLYYKTLQFTNATQMNDPFDCHPSLIDVSNVPKERGSVWGKDVVKQIETNKFERTRDLAWICSLSKVHNSLLMWSYYNKHKGVCIGLDMERARKYLSCMMGLLVGCLEWEVKYKDILEKPDLFKGTEDIFHYQLTTKAKEWKHEKEVRLISYDPSPMYMKLLPGQSDKDGPIPWNTMRAFLQLGGECFESIYLGINIEKDKKEKLITAAKQCNPNISIFQMGVDPEAFRLEEKPVSVGI